MRAGAAAALPTDTRTIGKRSRRALFGKEPSRRLAPPVDTRLFRYRALTAGMIAVLAVCMTLIPFFMILAFVLRVGLDRTPLVAAAAGVIGRRPVTQRGIPAVTVCRGSPRVVSGNIEVTAAF